jgi:hypothetical protein
MPRKKNSSTSPNFLLQKVFDLLAPFILADHKVQPTELNILADQYLPLVSENVNPLMQNILKQSDKLVSKAKTSRKPLSRNLAALKKAAAMHNNAMTDVRADLREIIIAQFEQLSRAKPVDAMTHFSDAVRFFSALDDKTINTHLLKAIIRILNESNTFEPSTLKLLALIGVLWDTEPAKLAKEVKSVG